jgi:hypothetical protein
MFSAAASARACSRRAALLFFGMVSSCSGTVPTLPAFDDAHAVSRLKRGPEGPWPTVPAPTWAVVTTAMSVRVLTQHLR